MCLLTVPSVIATEHQPPLAVLEVTLNEDTWVPERDEVIKLLACQIVTFRSVSYDPKDSPLIVVWSVNGVKKAEGKVFNFSSPEAHEKYIVKLTVTNEFSLNHSREIVVRTKENKKPSLESVFVLRHEELDEEEYGPDEHISLVIGINNPVIIRREYEEDSADDQLRTEALGASDIISESTCTESECETTIRFQEAGRFVIELVDMDLCNPQIVTVMNVEVVENNDPTAELTGPLYVREDEDLCLSGKDSETGGDKKDEIVQFCWKVVPWGENSYDYDWECSTDPDIEFSEDYGDYNVSLRVGDLYGGFDEVTETRFFDRTYNRHPEINFSGTPETVNLFEKVTIDLRNSTDDSKLVRMELRIFYLPEEDYEELVETIGNNELKAETTLNRTGEYRVDVKIFDDGDIPDEDGNPFPLSSEDEFYIIVLPVGSLVGSAPVEEATIKPAASELAVEEQTPPKEKIGNFITILVVVFVVIILIALVFTFSVWRKSKKIRGI